MGEPLACNDLAVGYEQGWTGKVDRARAAELFKMACQQGSDKACANSKTYQ
jgi:TPR repeat protein